ncbi:MAG: polymer-forming cytoskeletal protein [Desulforhopalus sp.]|nr:polymer-forming cytoskeletal protein [Desulforhopalus sp.]
MIHEYESIITKQMVISGRVECRGRVVLEGALEGSFSGQDLDIRETGRVAGDIAAKVISCAGHMEGSVITESLTLLRTGRHVGTVETIKLAVEPGAILDCALQSGAARGNGPVVCATVGTVQPVVDLSPLLTAFREGIRPCCMDVPWSERLEMYSQLLELLEKGKHLVKVTGESGSGKSQLIEKLRQALPAFYEVLLVKDLSGSVIAILQEVAAGLKISGYSEASQSELLSQIKAVLGDKRRAGRRVVLLVDDVEQMYPAAMEGMIRSLTNAYDHENGEEMLQIVLVGTKEMDSKMVATTTEYFEDETNCQLHLEPLNIKDTADYLRFCLQLAAGGGGGYSTALFPYETIRKIHALSHGNIAAINRLADKALRNAHASGASEVFAKFL